MADANSHITYHARAALCRGPQNHGTALSERHGRGMACVKQARSHSVIQMGKTTYTLCGTAWEQHGMCELALVGRQIPFCAVHKSTKWAG
jgi:hypothetical protein